MSGSHDEFNRCRPFWGSVGMTAHDAVSEFLSHTDTLGNETACRPAIHLGCLAPEGEGVVHTRSEHDADLQVQALARIARDDACRRGVKVGLYGESSNGARSLKESIAQAKSDLAAKIKANGGNESAGAC